VPETLRLRPGALEWRLVEGEIVVLDLNRSEYLIVNRTGTTLWHLLAEGASPADMVTHVVETYGLDPMRARADVETFLAALSARQLLETL
jgi:hypothetical protein